MSMWFGRLTIMGDQELVLELLVIRGADQDNGDRMSGPCDSVGVLCTGAAMTRRRQGYAITSWALPGGVEVT
jgi:hypothetical protein